MVGQVVDCDPRSARLGYAGVAAEECTQTSSPIETDRPDTTNSSLVVPVGSFQNENGVNISSRGGTRMFDGTNIRLRLGIAPCMEVLLDVPTYVAPIGGSEASGFTDVAPRVIVGISGACADRASLVTA